MSFERLGVCPLNVMVLLEGVWLCHWSPALAVALTLFFKMTSGGGAFHQMHHSLIKCCSLPRLMGLRADYTGLYIMSVCRRSTLLYPYHSKEKGESGTFATLVFHPTTSYCLSLTVGHLHPVYSVYYTCKAISCTFLCSY